MKTIILTFDRFPLRMLGCYGNHWIETPNFDRLAVRSVVFDYHFAECLGGKLSRHAWFDGCFHFAKGSQQAPTAAEISQLLRQAKIDSTMMVECDANAPSDDTPDFEEIINVTGCDGLEIDHSHTPFAEIISRADEWIATSAESDDSKLLWLKSRGVPIPWVPPDFFASLYLDELEAELEIESDNSESMASVDTAKPTDDESTVERDEPQPFDRICGDADGSVHPISSDEWQIARFVYAGYVTMLDVWLGRLLENIEKNLSGQPVVLIISAASGQLLGEQMAEDEAQNALPEQLVHTPLIIWNSAAEHLGNRRSDFVQTVDMLPTILDTFDIDSSHVKCDGTSLWPTVINNERIARDYVALGDAAGNTGIRTRELYLTRTSANQTRDESAENEAVALFLKPDDFWDVYDASEQRSEDVARLQATLDAFLSSARVDRPVVWPELQTGSAAD